MSASIDSGKAKMTPMPRIISVDDHLVEPAHLFQDRLPQKYKDEGPRIVIAPQGEMKLSKEGNWVETPGTGDKLAAWWHYEDHRYQLKEMIACAGMKPEDVSMQGVRYEDVRAACYEPKARIEDMKENHVDGSLCFPNYPRFCGQLFAERKDKVLSKLCVEAYNDFMVEEWCGDSHGYLIPLCIVPLWDPELAAAEVGRNAARGVRAVAFSEIPAWLGMPSIHTNYWDPFLRACEETKTVIAMHIGSGTKTVNTGEGVPTIVGANLVACNSIASMIDWIFSGKLDQFPGLQLLYAECQIGWIPYFVERADDIWGTHLWAQGEERIPNPPSHYYNKHVNGCFFKDTVGIDMIDKIGVDRIMFETDYPHQDGTYPHSKKIAENLFGHLDEESVYKIARGNAIKLLGLDRD